MKRIILLLLLTVITTFASKAQVGTQFPDFYKVTFWGDARGYWAEDISPFKDGDVRVLRFCHSNSLYTINKLSGEIITSTGIYKTGKLQSLQLLTQGESNEIYSIDVYQFEDEKKYPGMLKDVSVQSNSAILKVQFLHSGSIYEFIQVAKNIFYVTKSNGSYKIGAKVIQLPYALQDLKTFTK